MLATAPQPLSAALDRLRHSPLLPQLALLACAPLFWIGGGMGILGMVIVGLGVMCHRASATAWRVHAQLDAPPTASGPRGPAYMISQLIPIWSRQMNATRQHTGEGVQSLLDGFNGICGELSELANTAAEGATHDPQDVEALLAASSPAIDLLRRSAQGAVDTARHAQTQLTVCAEQAQLHRQLSNRLRAIARHTRIVAFNAAIEARRGQADSHSGFITLAEEVKLIASQLEEAANQSDQISTAIDDATAQARVDATLSASTASGVEQALHADVRQAMTLIFQAMGTQGLGGGSRRRQAESLRSQIDDIYVQFQFGDRVSQMLDLISQNMSSYVQWVSAHPHPTQADVDQWLKDLESSYSMEEQRAYHHGNAHVDTSQGIEFF
jgi:methyl-accepting chemotaxis protein